MSRSADLAAYRDSVGAALRLGDRVKALAVAVKGSRFLGNDAEKVIKAAQAVDMPAYFAAIGKDPEAVIETGLQVLKERFARG